MTASNGRHSYSSMSPYPRTWDAESLSKSLQSDSNAHAKAISSLKRITKEPHLLTTKNAIRSVLSQVQSLPEPQHLFPVPSRQTNSNGLRIKTNLYAQHDQMEDKSETPIDLLKNRLSNAGQSKEVHQNGEIDPVLEFYNARPKEHNDCLLRYTLLRQWEMGRLQRWRKWHDEKIQFLLLEEQKLLRKQAFYNKLIKSQHPWFNLDAEEEEYDSMGVPRRLRMHSDGVLNSKSKSLQQEMVFKETNPLSEKEPLLERRNALALLNQAHSNRKNSINTRLAESISDLDFSNIDISDYSVDPKEEGLTMDHLFKPMASSSEEKSNQLMNFKKPLNAEATTQLENEKHISITIPFYASSHMSPNTFLLHSRHKICVQLYECIESGRMFPASMSQKVYNRLVSRYDALLDCFTI